MSTNTRTRRFRGQQRGQGLTEYIIIVGLIAIFLITAVNKFGGELDTAYQGSDEGLENTVMPAMTGAGSGRSPNPASIRRAPASSGRAPASSGRDGEVWWVEDNSTIFPSVSEPTSVPRIRGIHPVASTG